jgi:trk system potassium uptake protein
MKIIILGCNQVSASLAENLASENTDITLVDPDADALRELKDRLDIGIAQGWPSHPDVLRAAGAEDADMIIAVTENDEVNMVACQIAYSIFKTPKKICRLRSASYIAQEDLFRPDAIPLDVVISPELLVSNYIKRLIDLPGSLQVLDFADGNAQLVAVRAYYGGPLVGQEIRFLREHMPKVDARVAAIFRRNRAITPEGSTVIEADDEVFFIAAPKNIKAVISELRRMDRPYRRLIIAGGGNIGARLASALEERYQVKVIEFNADRCTFLSEHLNKAVVLNGMSSDKKLLQEEGIADTDVFLALTNDDEANIMSALLAKRLGARKVMCLISNPAYVDLVQGGEIDIAISPPAGVDRQPADPYP